MQQDRTTPEASVRNVQPTTTAEDTVENIRLRCTNASSEPLCLLLALQFLEHDKTIIVLTGHRVPETFPSLYNAKNKVSFIRFIYPE
jgi:hypothetical protein